MKKVLAMLLGVMLLVGSSLSTGHGQSGGDGSKASHRKKHDFANSIGMKFVSISPGEFTMGSPDSEKGRFPNEVEHKVKLTRGFTMGVTPVTQGQWRTVMGTTVAQQRDKGAPKGILVGEGDALPIYYVSWGDAVEFCKRLGQTERRRYRLPTEAEWEYACRAGTQSAYGGSGNLDEMGWYGDNSGDQRIDSIDMWNKDPANYFQRLVTQHNCRPHPVGGKRPNAWGLYDMHGNVWHLCSDYYGNYPVGPTTDPTGPQQGTSRILRGGAWDIRPAFGRSAFRHKTARLPERLHRISVVPGLLKRRRGTQRESNRLTMVRKKVEWRMISFHLSGDALWQRMERAVQKVQERLERTAAALEQAGVPYAIIDGNAVRAWVAQADEAAVRTARDVDILLRRSDWPAAVAAMERAGFVCRHVKGIDMFLDGPGAKARDAVHVLFAGEKVRSDDPVPTPDVSEAEDIQQHRILRLDALVRMKLTAFRDKDRMHLRDMIDVELVNESWCGHLPPELAARLKELIDNPNG